MIRLVAVVMAAVWALAGWRNLPQLEHGTAAAAGTVIATSILLAYWCGTRRQRQSNLAAAVASAEATAVASVAAHTSASNAVTVNLFRPTEEARTAGRQARAGGLEDAPWMIGAHRQLDLEEAHGDAYMVARDDVEELA